MTIDELKQQLPRRELLEDWTDGLGGFTGANYEELAVMSKFILAVIDAHAQLEGYCVMPKKLTAENGAKGALSGEFQVTHRILCQSCGGVGCEDCNEEGGWDGEITIGWDTIKQIHESAVEACALPSAPQQGKSND
ncbi:hypothetical protein FEK48_13245 [Escherichia sp. E2593]|uniref:hypothetical protein n=1 Tax=unclassified Escherichia TaxID=2608889 RepID=UPI00102989CD|nr:MULTISPECIES: hypothetical protein [unclassified Escherichia]RZN40411.1 hypothetical protein D9738_13315 [Escherichia sp. E10V5]TGC06840.1 hypothetical protein CRG93_18565 [Escherichia sp. E2593]TLI81917.1 hypothetical protein FEK48_13245 [Escherichia sp. E2593]